MKITNHPVGSPSVTPQPPAQEPAIGAADSIPESTVRSTNAYSPSLELQRLLDLVRSEPEIRSERVQEVAQRLQQNDYLSASTDEQTAQRMLAERDW